MHISYFDDARLTESLMKRKERLLTSYREQLRSAEAAFDLTVPEAALYYPKDIAFHEMLAMVKRQAKGIKHVVVVGIGGSSLGVEAVHAVLNQGGATLHVLDTASVAGYETVHSALMGCKKVSQIALCIISKSGGTTETLANAAIILNDLEERFGQTIYDQTYFIGNEGTDFMKTGKRLGAQTIAMPVVIGGRYSVATAVGLVPLTLLGHDVDEFISGYLDALSPTLESVVVESAARLASYHGLKYPHYNFFAFESRLERLGAWYRQLFAESLGKEINKKGVACTFSMVPTISTPVELHSVGQLYMSGVPATYTDFVSFDDNELDVMIPKKTKIAKNLKGLSLQEVATALYGGTVAAYQERQLPYRATVFEEGLAYSVGQFMAMRLREVMYVAELLGVDAFDQPNVELYKQKTKEILFV